MVTEEQLNEDQLKSFYYMTEFNGFSKGEALQLIQELCINKGYTGLRVEKFHLNPEGQRRAWELEMDKLWEGQ